MNPWDCPYGQILKCRIRIDPDQIPLVAFLAMLVGTTFILPWVCTRSLGLMERKIKPQSVHSEDPKLRQSSTQPQDKSKSRGILGESVKTRVVTRPGEEAEGGGRTKYSQVMPMGHNKLEIRSYTDEERVERSFRHIRRRGGDLRVGAEDILRSQVTSEVDYIE